MNTNEQKLSAFKKYRMEVVKMILGHRGVVTRYVHWDECADALAGYMVRSHEPMQARIKELEGRLSQMRVAVSNYVASEGCSCCERAEHKEHQKVVANLLDVPAYEDGSGYDFYKFAD
jgi:hypothetical protein